MLWFHFRDIDIAIGIAKSVKRYLLHYSVISLRSFFPHSFENLTLGTTNDERGTILSHYLRIQPLSCYPCLATNPTPLHHSCKAPCLGNIRDGRCGRWLSNRCSLTSIMWRGWWYFVVASHGMLKELCLFSVDRGSLTWLKGLVLWVGQEKIRSTLLLYPRNGPLKNNIDRALYHHRDTANTPLVHPSFSFIIGATKNLIRSDSVNNQQFLDWSLTTRVLLCVCSDIKHVIDNFWIVCAWVLCNTLYDFTTCLHTSQNLSVQSQESIINTRHTNLLRYWIKFSHERIHTNANMLLH